MPRGVLGLDIGQASRLFETGWPADWSAACNRPHSGYFQPDAVEAVAVLRAIADGRIAL